MVVAGLLLLLPALRGKKVNLPGGNREQNISIAKERMQELKNELEAGTLTQETYQETLEELEKRLFSESGFKRHCLVCGWRGACSWSGHPYPHRGGVAGPPGFRGRPGRGGLYVSETVA